MKARFSIAGLMAAVLLFAAGFFVLRNASALWASILFTSTVVLLAAASVGAAACRGHARHGCLGFSVFGWIYLLAAFWLWPVVNGVTPPPFLTKVLLDAVQPAVGTPAMMTIDPGPAGETLQPDPRPLVFETIPGSVNVSRQIPFTGKVMNLLHHRRIGHTLTALALGFLGGLLALLIRERGEASTGR